MNRLPNKIERLLIEAASRRRQATAFRNMLPSAYADRLDREADELIEQAKVIAYAEERA